MLCHNSKRMKIYLRMKSVKATFGVKYIIKSLFFTIKGILRPTFGSVIGIAAQWNSNKFNGDIV